METFQPKLRFPEFKGDWERKKIDDVSELTSSKRVYLSDYVEIGIPFFRGKEITELKQNKQPSDILYITEKSYNEFKLKYGVPQINDILMTAVGTLGNVYKIRDNKPFYFKDGNLIWFRDIKENSDFFEILLDYKNNDIQKTSIGSTQRALTMVELRKLFFFFPSIEEQTKIANFLSSVDEKLNLLKEKKELLEEYKKGMMQKIFNQELRFKDDDGNDFEDWEEKTLGEVAKFRRGSFPQPYGLPKWYDDENGMPFIQVYDVGENMLLKHNTKNKISKIGAEQSVFVKKGTLVISIQGSIGRIAKTQYDAYVDRTLLIFQSYNLPIDVDYFKYVVFLLFEIEKTKAPGGTIKTITKEALTDFEVPIPSIEEQTKIANFLSAIDEKIELVSVQIEETQEYKKGLLQQMFV